MTISPSNPALEAERIARHAYGRVLAVIACATRDLHQAEDALAGALVEALQKWPRDGVPENPEGWLVVAAKRNAVDQARTDAASSQARTSAQVIHHFQRLQRAQAVSDADDSRAAHMPEDRLRVMFVCAHPAIETSVHAPLILQALLGLSAQRIASAFLLSPTTMGQRLVRAKAKLRDACVSFDLPPRQELDQRVPEVLNALYAAYNAAHDEPRDGDLPTRALASEAIELAEVVTRLLPQQPEAWGMRALLLLSHARRDARRDGAGRYVPLDQQDCDLWDKSMIREGDRFLREAAKFSTPGRFQLEAAIQSVHVDRAQTGITNWQAILSLYDVLVRVRPTVGASVGRAAAVCYVEGPEAAIQQLELIDQRLVPEHQPYWAVKADVLARAGKSGLAIAAYDRAMALTDDPTVRAFLLERREKC